MTLIDYFKAFHSTKETLNLSAGSQAVYISILGEFNAARFPERLSISTRELKALAGLKSTNAVIENRNVLKNKKLIDFQTKNGVTTYSLSTEHLLNTCRTPAEQSLNSNRTPEANSNIRTREDVKTLDVKTFNSNNSAREAVEMDVHELWEYETGYQLTGSIAYELEVLEREHGRDAFHQALQTAVASNSKGRVTFNYFKAILEGGEKHENSSRVVQLYQRTDRPNRRGARNSASTSTGDGGGSKQYEKPNYDWLYQNKRVSPDDKPAESAETHAR